MQAGMVQKRQTHCVPLSSTIPHSHMQVHVQVHWRAGFYAALWRAVLDRIHCRKVSVSCLSLKKRFLPGRNEITISLLSFLLKLSCLALDTFRIKDVVKMKWRAAVHKSIKTPTRKAQQGTRHLLSHSECFTKWKKWQTSGSFHCHP